MERTASNSYNGKKLLILGASELQVPAIRCAKALGITTLVADFDPRAAGMKLADRAFDVSTLDFEAVLDLARREKVDGILTICSDRPMTVVARVGEALGLHTISAESAKLATNKACMRQALAEHGVPVPRFTVCRDEKEFMEGIEEHDCPFIVKPSDNSGSRGIILVETKEDAGAAYHYAKANSMDGVVLVEEYMRGPEVSVEVFVMHGEPQVVQITDKITTGAPHFVEMGHTQPSMLPEAAQEDIRRTAIAAVKALGIDKGPAHVEIKVTEQGAKIVELGARLGGDYIATDLVPLSTGFSMVEAAVLCAMGEPVPEYKIKKRYAAIRYFQYEHAINLTQDAIAALERIYMNRVENTKIESSRDREGFFVVSGESYEELCRKMDVVTGAFS